MYTTTRSHCFSCGNPVPDRKEAPRLAALCPRCAHSSPRNGRLPSLMVRVGEARPLGPLTREAALDQLNRNLLGAEDLAARTGGAWSRVCEQPDLRAAFIPGAPEQVQRSGAQQSNRRDLNVGRASRLLAGAAVVLVSLGALGAAAYGASQGWFVLPQSWVDRFSSFASEQSHSINTKIEQAVDQGAAARAVQARKSLSHPELIDQLKAAHPSIEGSASLHFARGQAALWKGDLASLKEARSHLEKAVVLSPEDPDFSTALAMTYGELQPHLPELAAPLAQVAQRVEEMGQGTLQAHISRAAVHLGAGDLVQAADQAYHCGDPPGQAATPGTAVDLRCALIVARHKKDVTALLQLNERLPGVWAIRLALAQAALDKGDLANAIDTASEMSRQHPNEAGPWQVLLQAYARVGEWDKAVAAGKRVEQVQPSDLSSRRLLYEIQLKVKRQPREALAGYEALLAMPAFESSDERVRIFTDAAAAAVEVGAFAKGIQLSDRALSLDSGNPAACLQKARAMVAQKAHGEAEAALRLVDLGRVSGHRGARFHIGAARLYTAMGRARTADTESEQALDDDPQWSAVWLESARTRLAVDNLEGAIEQAEQVAYTDMASDRYRNPLQEVWYPDSGWKGLRALFEQRLLGDVRFAGRSQTVVGIAALAAGDADAARQLEKVFGQVAEAPAARIALAQYLVSRGQDKAAFEQVDKVQVTRRSAVLVAGLRGHLLARLGRASDAQVAFNQALQEGEGNVAVQRWRAMAFYAQGDKEGARQALGVLLSASSDDLGAHSMLLQMGRDR